MDLAGPKPTNEWLAYVAGYIDGEGCLDAGSNGGTARVQISNTFPGVLKDIAEVFGGKVRSRPGWKVRHRANHYYLIHGEPAKTLCRLLLPYLREKRYQAELLLRLNDYPRRSAMRESILRRLKGAKRLEYQTAD